MYTPNHFALPREYLRSLLSEPRSGNLVTYHEGLFHATYLPMHLEQRSGRQVVVSHMLKINPQAKIAVTSPGLAIFDYTNAYVSPKWYITNEAKPSVPTWDYITIHLKGAVRIHHQPEQALKDARHLSAKMGEDLEHISAEKLDLMARAIVGVEMEVETIEAKAKMSQNRHPDDIRSLIAHFETHGPAEFVSYLREVSLPYAQHRFETIQKVKAAREIETTSTSTVVSDRQS